MKSEQMVEIIQKSLEDKKAENILALDVKEKTSLADYFIIASGKSTPQVKALADNVDEKMGEAGFPAKRVDGYGEGRWIVLDYGDVIVHVFHDETRLFYHLERLWE